MNGNERDKSINLILESGLEPCPTAFARICALFRGLGLRFLFWDTAFSMIFTLVTMLGALAVMALCPAQHSHTAAAAISPLLFLVITLFAETAERAGALYELKQTCYYTAAQTTALRAICYSVLGLVFTVIVVAIGAAGTGAFWSLLLLCLCVFLLCACIQVSALRFFRQKWATAVASGAWVFVNLALPVAFAPKWEAILRSVPHIAVGIIAILCAAVLTWQIRKLIMEGKTYVVA